MIIHPGKSGEMNLSEIYKGKKVFVTGHTGFKGGWLSIWLDMLGAEVTGYALDPLHKEGIFNASGIGRKIRDLRGDIRDFRGMLEVFSKEKPEIVFHLAAQPLVLEGYKNPRETFETNTQGTANVLEAIRLTPSVKLSVMVTSDKCYENKEWLWGYRECDPMGGYDPYSASKGASELVINAYRNSFFRETGKPAIASARAGNVMGGGDWAENRLIPDIIRSVSAGRPIGIRNPYATRPWQHVLEPLSGYLILGAALMESPEQFTGAWNFGPLNSEIYTVREVVDSVVARAGKGAWEDLSTPGRPHEAGLLGLDISKAIQKLKWKPLLKFDDTVRMTVDWYFNKSGKDILTHSQDQIDYYQSLWSSGS